MTDADTIRNILTRYASFPFTNGDARTEALAALDRLVAEMDRYVTAAPYQEVDEMRRRAEAAEYNFGVELDARKAAEAENARLLLGMEVAWGVIANASEGNWNGETEEWRDAAVRWRDEHWHPALDRHSLAPKEDA